MAPSVRAQATNVKPFLIYSPEAPQTVGNKKITLHKNEVEAKGAKNPYSFGQAFFRFLDSAEGLFRIGQLGERIPKFINETRAHFGKDRLIPLDNCSSFSSQAWRWLTTIPHAICMTPGTAAAVKDATNAWNDKTQTSEQKRYRFEKAIHETFDTIGMYSYSLANIISVFPSMIPHVRSVVQFGDSATLVHDSLSCKINAENLARVCAVDTSKATRAMKEAIAGTKVYTIAAMAKDFFATIGGIFGLIVTGVMPVVGTAFLSLAATLCAVTKIFSREMLHHKPIAFLDNRHVTQIKV